MTAYLAAFILAQQVACLQEALYHEARGEGFVGMAYVAATIHNRVLDPRWPDNHCDVIGDPWQYSYRNGGADVTMADKASASLTKDVATMFMTLPAEEMFDDILYYHTTSITVRWDMNKIEQSVVIGNHVFYIDTH